MTPESENEQNRTAAARDKLAKAGEAQAERAAQAAERAKWRPTPTQEECDLVAMGASIDEVGHADDGSGPDPYAQTRVWKRPADDGAPEQTREMRPAAKTGGYETR
jgi:hypothetical protein